MSSTVAVILARGGSKGIPGKNLKLFCGHPLVAWSIHVARAANSVDFVFVSSDDRAILDVARDYGARTILRPGDLSTDLASSESGWVHAAEIAEQEIGPISVLVALQATSPVRESEDIEQAVSTFNAGQFDSVFSAAVADDFLMWKREAGELVSQNYNYQLRGRRQERAPQYLENGSIYVFSPTLLRKAGNRLGGKIGIFLMPLWKSMEIDSLDDFLICESLMRGFLLSTGLRPHKVVRAGSPR